ncbi:exodeoxyribonuclease VII large subunit [Bisgaardia hudsonensis]|uniref:Exodeoxyribonuclease 7 large subunit n=1 Tax=Bisgaardia hudsonensis TaxID=109472 RepID=A0A4R2N2Z6_9PAST|nr:exodeoxyribonuclease VII large subunit [Bisgaardia hudsonensis]QLB12630.1 exodeoxyribonuclease VII large subunit [Bisgaardia hudsonensis]TCP14172.1 exodeoxyribonuclease VII large subunit [Bisgaardia hudsonensis]
MSEQLIYSVTQLNQSAKRMLETQFGLVWLTGEISNFTQPVSGHWYLTLKDENSQVRCAMFRMKNARVLFQPKNGMQVLVRANVSLYEARGDYQLIIESMQTAGEGLLQQKFDALKMKLASEGLFAQNLKKKLPHFVKKVGIVTSKTGAALQDILNILKRRDPTLEIIIYPTSVQGKEATAEIVQMIELANQREEVDVLIVGRGGGSLEDLWCFNEESVARAIYNSFLPIVSAVGHETDITIADFVADMRAPTPSAAAELVSRDKKELSQQIVYYQQRLEMALDRIFNHKLQDLKQIRLRLQNQHPLRQLRFQQDYMQQLTYRLNTAIKYLLEKENYQFTTLNERLLKNPLQYRLQKNKHKIEIQQERLYKIPLFYFIQQQRQYLLQSKIRLNTLVKNKIDKEQYTLSKLCANLDGLSPLKILSRGYAIAETKKGIIIRNINQVNANETIRTIISDGIIISKIDEIRQR